MARTSRIPGFYKRPLEERVRLVAEWAGLDDADVTALRESLALAQADKMIENVVGRHALPLGLGLNFIINGREVLVPMSVEEPSVVAAVSNAARIARSGGGFLTGSTEPIMIGQIQVLDVPDPRAAQAALHRAKADILRRVDDIHPSLVRRGGGARDLRVRYLPHTPVGPMLVVHLYLDVRDAMGANLVNTAVEGIAPLVERLTRGRVNLRILSNYTTERRAWAVVRIPVDAFSEKGARGEEVARGIVEANAFAWADPYRAATHNKGIMNGIDAVAIATGNDWRAIEAAAHAWAARDGQYRALTEWYIMGDTLVGKLELPLAVGIVGGATKVHPTARVALKILDVHRAQDLAEIMVAVGLAQNLAALRALASEGIQRGHMRMHARQVAIAAGAVGEEIDIVAARLAEEGNVRESRAREIVEEMRGND
ncbi:MAG: hydroxymethylglutaryl-CoA reductase, degradative [Chloroflexi bacterium]|nr:hydroxymethylglutaryl-CoA reductase, degradative [Chloroflexota bacterium]